MKRKDCSSLEGGGHKRDKKGIHTSGTRDKKRKGMNQWKVGPPREREANNYKQSKEALIWGTFQSFYNFNISSLELLSQDNHVVQHKEFSSRNSTSTFGELRVSPQVSNKESISWLLQELQCRLFVAGACFSQRAEGNSKGLREASKQWSSG